MTVSVSVSTHVPGFVVEGVLLVFFFVFSPWGVWRFFIRRQTWPLVHYWVLQTSCSVLWAPPGVQPHHPQEPAPSFVCPRLAAHLQSPVQPGTAQRSLRDLGSWAWLVRMATAPHPAVPLQTHTRNHERPEGWPGSGETRAGSTPCPAEPRPGSSLGDLS